MDNFQDWIDVDEAAQLSGKSLSTIRRLIPEMEQNGHLRREPGTGKVYISRSHLVTRFRIRNDAKIGTQEGGTVAGIVDILQRQLDAQNAQILALQRDGEAKSRQLEEAQQHAAQLLENLRQATTLNAALQTKILTIGAGTEAKEPTTSSYWIAVAVLLSLVCSLVVWLFIQWVGNG